jgi:hypothetical protein
LAQIYSQIADKIIQATYAEQTIQTTGNFSTILYPDSYIEFSHNQQAIPAGIIITNEKLFSDPFSAQFDIPENSSIIEAQAISYSGPRWTKELIINNHTVYNISDYGESFIYLGDPFRINIPLEKINKTNTIRLTTGTSSKNFSQGSQYNKIIYTLMKNVSSYSSITSLADGCLWNIEFEDNTNISTLIPPTYSGTEHCKYSQATKQYNLNDAIQIAVYNLLVALDSDKNGKVDIKFPEQSLQLSSSAITGIPFTWSTEVQVRAWR